MPPRARARSRPSGPAPLTDIDISTLREKLDTGKKPRVMLLVGTALDPAGTSVPIVSFAEPPVGEFISVRLRGDVVPFSPTELALPMRGWPAATTLPMETPPSRPVPTPVPARPYKPAKTEDSPRPARLVAVPEPPPELPESGQDTVDPGPVKAPAKAAGRKPSKSGGLSLTLRFTGQAWTYESTRSGRRSAAKPLNLAAVRAFTDRLDDPGLRKDLQVAIDVCRQQAQTRADALRAELERVEVELAELDE